VAQIDDDIEALLARHAPPVAALARELIAVLREMRPDLTPKVQLGWGSVNFRHKAAGFLCAVFPQAREGNVILVFEHGRLLSSPLLVDNGKVKQVRWIPLSPGDEIPVDEIGILIVEAIALRS
jgi:hypothetical protein